MDLNNKFFEYIQTRDHYYHNMEITLGKGEYRKSSKLLWGAITQSIKALASLPPSPREITRHNDFFDFTGDTAKETRDAGYYELFVGLNALHKNFYDEIIPENSFLFYLKNAKKFLQKTQDLIDKKLKQYDL